MKEIRWQWICISNCCKDLLKKNSSLYNQLLFAGLPVHLLATLPGSLWVCKATLTICRNPCQVQTCHCRGTSWLLEIVEGGALHCTGQRCVPTPNLSWNFLSRIFHFQFLVSRHKTSCPTINWSCHQFLSKLCCFCALLLHSLLDLLSSSFFTGDHITNLSPLEKSISSAWKFHTPLHFPPLCQFFAPLSNWAHLFLFILPPRPLSQDKILPDLYNLLFSKTCILSKQVCSNNICGWKLCHCQTYKGMGTSFDSTLEVLKGLNKFCDNRKNTKMDNISHAIHIGIIQCKRHEDGQHGSL